MTKGWLRILFDLLLLEALVNILQEQIKGMRLHDFHDASRDQQELTRCSEGLREVVRLRFNA